MNLEVGGLDGAVVAEAADILALGEVGDGGVRTAYPTLIATIGSERWLVMIGLDGVMETAFPPDDMDKYLSNDGFMYLGLLGDFLI